MPTESSLLINVNEILSFFDEKPPWADRHSAGVVGMIFEDLAAATLQRGRPPTGGLPCPIRARTPGRPSPPPIPLRPRSTPWATSTSGNPWRRS